MTDRTAITATGALLDDADALRHISSDIKYLTAKADAIKARLRDAVPPGTDLIDPDGTPLIRVAPGMARFSATRAAEVLTPDQLAAVSRTTPDAKLARSLLAPAIYEALCVESAPVVSVL